MSNPKKCFKFFPLYSYSRTSNYKLGSHIEQNNVQKRKQKNTDRYQKLLICQRGSLNTLTSMGYEKTKDSVYYHEPIVDTGNFFLEPIHHSNCHRTCIMVYSFHFLIRFPFLNQKMDQIKLWQNVLQIKYCLLNYIKVFHPTHIKN